MIKIKIKEDNKSNWPTKEFNLFESISKEYNINAEKRKMYNPCEICNLRFGHAYMPDCDEKCEFASVVKENKRLKAESNIVHCRDCVHYKRVIGAVGGWCDCTYTEFETEPDDFCCFGIRKE